MTAAQRVTARIPGPRPRIVSELGMQIEMVGDELHGSVEVVPEMSIPGTDSLRISLLAMWTDLVGGLLVSGTIAPKVPVTLELAVEMHCPPVRCRRLRAVGRLIKAGSSIVVVGVDISADGRPVAVGTATFMSAPDTTLEMPTLAENLRHNHTGGGRLTEPFADRAHCARSAAGVAVLTRSADGVNSSNTISGGLLSLVMEEAALSADPGADLSSLSIRYLRPARVGPVVAAAHVDRGLARIEAHDSGDNDRLVAVATTRSFR